MDAIEDWDRQRVESIELPPQRLAELAKVREEPGELIIVTELEPEAAALTRDREERKRELVSKLRTLLAVDKSLANDTTTPDKFLNPLPEGDFDANVD